jgi:multimeric flavodoxin WrbA
MILGIGASGRKDMITSKTVKAILEDSGQEYEFISLAGKKINGCIGCTQCDSDNICKVKDDWNEIGEKMRKADAIVFGAPDYYDTINALGHACLERTFSFRHRGGFSLEGKYGISVSASYSEQGNEAVHSIIKKFMLSNRMIVIDSVSAEGYSQCYNCNYGHMCSIGNVVKANGFIDKIEKKHCPPCFEEQKRTNSEAYRVGTILGETLKDKFY